jgi:hypothetical protein
MLDRAAPRERDPRRQQPQLARRTTVFLLHGNGGGPVATGPQYRSCPAGLLIFSGRAGAGRTHHGHDLTMVASASSWRGRPHLRGRKFMQPPLLRRRGHRRALFRPLCSARHSSSIRCKRAGITRVALQASQHLPFTEQPSIVAEAIIWLFTKRACSSFHQRASYSRFSPSGKRRAFRRASARHSCL